MNARHLPGRALAALLVAAALLAPQAARAGIRVVTPEMFQPLDTAVPTLITPGYIASGSSSPAELTAPLRLPAGSTIRKLVFYHWSIGPGTTTVALARTKVGAAAETSDILLFGIAQDELHFPSEPPLKTENLLPNPNADLTVRKGYRYFLIVNSSGITQAVTGVKVHYQ
jgi:hypothetical protein